ncbi:MAG TPA: S4 domain-containing protein, partial [Kofleriaceae bacterium]|nr:S4 domain-containing protein [Kofleriaceae bacterium]
MSDPGPGQTSFVVGADEDDRLDRVLSRRFPQASRKRLAELFAEGAVRVDGRVARKGDRAAPGAEVRLTRPPTGDADLRPVGDPEAAARLTVLHEDDGVAGGRPGQADLGAGRGAVALARDPAVDA